MPLAFAIAQILDAATYHRATEVNQTILALGDAAYLVKVLLICAVLAIAYALQAGRYAWVRRPLLVIGTVVGLWGAMSNL
jgi:hypothetical protein